MPSQKESIKSNQVKLSKIRLGLVKPDQNLGQITPNQDKLKFRFLLLLAKKVG